MKKQLLTLIFLLSSLYGSAQVTYGFKGGINISSMAARRNYGGSSNVPSEILRPNIGFTLERPLGGFTFLQSEIQLQWNGHQFLRKSPGTSFPRQDGVVSGAYISRAVFQSVYLQLPVHLGYTVGEGNRNLSVFGGLYLAAGLIGRYKFEYSDGKSESGSISFWGSKENFAGQGNIRYRTFSTGISLGLGTKLKDKYFMSVTYQQGLVPFYPKVEPNAIRSVNQYHKVLAFNVTYIILNSSATVQ